MRKSIIFAIGTFLLVSVAVAGVGATDYKQAVNVTATEYDESGNESGNASFKSSFAYDENESFLVWDGSTEDMNVSNFTDGINGYDLQPPSGATTNPNGWNFSGTSNPATVNVSEVLGTNQSALTLSVEIEPNYNSTAGSWESTRDGNDAPLGGIKDSSLNAPAFGIALANSQDANVFINGSAVVTEQIPKSGNVTLTASVSDGTLSLREGGNLTQTSVGGIEIDNLTDAYVGAYSSIDYDATFRGYTLTNETGSSVHERLRDGHRLGKLSPQSSTTTGRTINSGSIEYVANGIYQYADVDVMTEQYDGVEWQEIDPSPIRDLEEGVTYEINLTTDAEYRHTFESFESFEDTSSVPLESGGLFRVPFTSYDVSALQAGAGVVIAVLLFVVAWFVPGFRVFGVTSSGSSDSSGGSSSESQGD